MKTPKARQCAAPACRTWTLDRYCKRHRPAGAWAIASATREEHEQRREHSGEELKRSDEREHTR